MDKQKEIERIERIRDIVANRIEQDIFVPRRLLTIQGKEIDELIDLLGNYMKLIDSSSDKFTGEEMDMILKYQEASEAVTVQTAIMNAISLALDHIDD